VGTATFKDYYAILGVANNVTVDEIKKAFRDKAKQYHPDVCKLPDAHQRFIEVGEAYEILKDPETRRQYDEFIRQASQQRGQGNTYKDFGRAQQQAQAQAESYAGMDLEDLIVSVLGFAYEVGRAIVVGERDKPKLTFGDYVRLGLCGFLLTIAIIATCTGVGTIPGIMLFKGAYDLSFKDGKFLGFGPLILSTIIADVVIVVSLFYFIDRVICG
jgi:hypothetical protein